MKPPERIIGNSAAPAGRILNNTLHALADQNDDKSMLKKLFEHPMTRGLSVDDRRTTLLRRDIIQQKKFLNQIYREWYESILRVLRKKEYVLELGSGAGFFRDYLPDAITSEIFLTSDLRLVADACHLPFGSASLDAIVMTDVLHHIPNVREFFIEAKRCIRQGGQIIMIEPWRTRWSEKIYTHLHSEPFLPDEGWEIPSKGPLSGANGALPWIIFHRDRAEFEAQFPEWRISGIHPMMPFTYLLSGGVSMRSILPGFMYEPLRGLEKMLFQEAWAMFVQIELILEGNPAGDTASAADINKNNTPTGIPSS